MGHLGRTILLRSAPRGLAPPMSPTAVRISAIRAAGLPLTSRDYRALRQLAQFPEIVGGMETEALAAGGGDGTKSFPWQSVAAGVVTGVLIWGTTRLLEGFFPKAKDDGDDFEPP